MSKKLVTKILFLLIAVFFTIFLLSKPYNQMCRAVNWCHPVSFSYLLPCFKGDKSLQVNFKAQSSIKDIKFMIIGDDSVSLRSGEKYSATFRIVNDSSQDVTLRPVRFFENGKFGQFIKFYECLCMQSYKVDAGDFVDLVMRLKIKSNFDNNAEFKDDNTMTIGYDLTVE